MSPPLPAAKLTHIWPTPTCWMTIGLGLLHLGAEVHQPGEYLHYSHIMPEYGLSETQIGRIFSAFAFGYAGSQTPAAGWATALDPEG